MKNPDTKPMMRLRLWLETEEGLYFGLGRALLLAKVEEHGSLRKAAEEMSMSYRAAWGKIKKTEEIMGVKLISQGGSKKEGYQLTDAGRMLMEKYLAWFEEVERLALLKAREMLPWPIKSFDTAGRARGDMA